MTKSELSMGREIRVVHYGLGSIGTNMAQLVATKPGLVSVGAIDIAREKVGRDLGAILGIGRSLGVTVSKDAAEVLRNAKPDLVLHATSSFLERIRPEIMRAVEVGADVISTAEELAYPFRKHPDITKEIDDAARKNEVTIVGTGVNPGFVMDSLALILTAPVQNVKEVLVQRVVDAATRRQRLQAKIGAGLTLTEFDKKLRAGELGHVGLSESVSLIAAGLGWKLERVDEKLIPIIARTTVMSRYLTVKPGEVAGVHQTAIGTKAGKRVIKLDLRLLMGARRPRDSVKIVGNPPVEMMIRNGIQGDLATVAVAVNMIPRVIAARVGLMTMKDLVCPSYFEAL